MDKTLQRRSRKALLIAMALSSTSAIGCPVEPFIGAVCFTANNFCDAEYYIEADGRSLNVSEYEALYALIGDKFRRPQDTQSTPPKTFRVPDLQGRTPVGTGKGKDLKSRLLGEVYGEEQVTLDEFNLPPHDQNFDILGSFDNVKIDIPVSTNMGEQVIPSGDVYPGISTAGSPIYTSATPDAIAYMPFTIPKAKITLKMEIEKPETAVPFNISQPSTVLKACIATKGTWPSRW